MNREKAVVAEELHRDRGRRLDRRDSIGAGGGADALAAELERERRMTAEPSRRSSASPSSCVVVTSSRTRSGPVALETSERGGEQHRPRLEPELDRARSDRVNELGAPGYEPEPRAGHAVLVQTRHADVDPELERAGLAKASRADASAAVVRDDDDLAVARGGDDRRQLVGRELVRHRETRHDDHVDAQLGGEGRDEGIRADAVDEPPRARRTERTTAGCE